VHANLPKIFSLIGETIPENFENTVSSYPKFINSREKIQVSWEALPDGLTKTRLIEMSKRYGYLD
jgi:hypothetical protein